MTLLNMSTIFSFFILVILLRYKETRASQLSTSQQSSTSFSVDLINREFSPLSPYYNPQTTHFERVKNVINRSISRLSRLQSTHKSLSTSSGGFESTIQYNEGEYLTKVKVGTPPAETLLIADTGSALTWLQCKPCQICFKHVYPLFDIQNSSSYKPLECESKFCQDSLATCNRQRNKCEYSTAYPSGSTSGDLATEKLTFGKTSMENITIGCGFNNGGYFSNITSGILGLGGGTVSIINQLDKTIQGKFSYCMVPIFGNGTSRLTFGEVYNPKAVSTTPLFVNPNDGYYMTLENVIIGNKTFEYKMGEEKSGGNIMIDSGTTFSAFASGEFYNSIISALKEYIGATTIPTKHKYFDLCYNSSSKIEVPLIAYQFTGDAIWNIPASSAFVEVDPGVTCFALQALDLSLPSKFGNFFQQNYLVSHDLQNKKISFQATDCTKNTQN